MLVGMFSSSATTRRDLPLTGEENLCKNSDLSLPLERSIRSMSETDHQSRIEVPKKSYQVHRIDPHQNRKRLRSCTMHNISHIITLIDGSTSGAPGSPVNNESSILTQLFANQRLQRAPSSSSVKPTQSDHSRTEQNGPHGVVDSSKPHSILVSSFLAQGNPKLPSAKE